MKVLLTIVGIQGSFLMIFLVFFTLFRWRFQTSIIFYSGLNMIFCVGLMIVTLIYHYRKKIKLNLNEALLHLMLFCFISYSFIITIPTLLDRSISLLFITAISESGDSGVTREELQNIFWIYYVDGYSVVDKRIEEQLQGNNIIQKQNRFFITKKGNMIYKFNVKTAELFNIDKKLIQNIFKNKNL